MCYISFNELTNNCYHEFIALYIEYGYDLLLGLKQPCSQVFPCLFNGNCLLSQLKSHTTG